MAEDAKWNISKDQQMRYIDALSPELINLRSVLGISQGDLARILGISRQTYSAIESEKRLMSWNTYLSLLFFYDYNIATHDMLRSLSAFPSELIRQFNDGNEMSANETAIAGIPDVYTRNLDAQALHAIRTVVMMEYARCENADTAEVLKAFEKVSVLLPAQQTHVKKRKIRKRKKQPQNTADEK